MSHSASSKPIRRPHAQDFQSPQNKCVHVSDLETGVSAARSVPMCRQQRAPGSRPGHTLLDISTHSDPTTQSETDPSNR